MKALLSITEAAHVAGKSRATLHRYIKAGKLATTVDAAGNKCIDVNELLRVFGELKNAPRDTVAELQKRTGRDSETDENITPDVSVESVAIMAMREELRLAKEREQWLKERLSVMESMFTQERNLNVELEQKLLALEAPKKKSLLARLFGG